MITRRKLLLGAGAMMLLRPFVNFHRARAQEVTTPPVLILAHKCQVNYANQDTATFIPEMSGSSMVLSPMLASLSGYESMTTVLAGVDIRNFRAGNADPHHSAVAQFHGDGFDGSLSNVGGVTPRGETVDQFVARTWGTTVRVTDAGRYPGRRADYRAAQLSWKRDGDRIVADTPPLGLQATFTSLIGNMVGGSGMTMEEYARRARRGQSLLDRHLADVRTLQSELPSDVAAQLESHVDGFREFERATFEPEGGAVSCDQSGVLESWREAPGNEASQDWIFKRAKLYAEMIAFAAACGQHRVFVYSLADDNSSNMQPREWDAGLKPVAYRGTDQGSSMIEHPAGRPNRKFIGNNGCDGGDPMYHFNFCHCRPPDDHVMVEDYIFRYSFGYLVRQLDARGVLPHSLIVYSTAQALNHSNEGHSWLLIGGAGGRHRGNRVLRFGRFGGGSAISNNQVLASVCQLLGIERESYGDPAYGTGGVPGLL